MIAVTIISTIAVGGAVGSVFWGMFAERVRPQKLLACNAFGAAVVCPSVSSFYRALICYRDDLPVPETTRIFRVYPSG